MVEETFFLGIKKGKRKNDAAAAEDGSPTVYVYFFLQESDDCIHASLFQASEEGEARGVGDSSGGVFSFYLLSVLNAVVDSFSTKRKKNHQPLSQKPDVHLL